MAPLLVDDDDVIASLPTDIDLLIKCDDLQSPADVGQGRQRHERGRV